MHTIRDYSKSPAPHFDAIQDIREWLGEDKWSELYPLMSQVPTQDQFRHYCWLAGIQGLPVVAWWELIHGQDSWIHSERRLGEAGDVAFEILDNDTPHRHYTLCIWQFLPVEEGRLPEFEAIHAHTFEDIGALADWLWNNHPGIGLLRSGTREIETAASIGDLVRLAQQELRQ